MKRIISLWIVLLLIFVSFAVSESNSDISKMSYDELIELRKEIDEQLAKRYPMMLNRIQDKTYRVGIDIKPGLYELTVPIWPRIKGVYVTAYQTRIVDFDEKYIKTIRYKDSGYIPDWLDLKEGDKLQILMGPYNKTEQVFVALIPLDDSMKPAWIP